MKVQPEGVDVSTSTSSGLFWVLYVYVYVAAIVLHVHMCMFAVASDLNYPAQDRFGNLVIPDVQVVNSGEFMVLVRLPGLGVNNEPLNANSPRSVNVEVQG